MALTDDDLRLRKGDAWLRFEAACEILAGNGIDVAKRAEFYLSDDTTAREAGAPNPADAPLRPADAARLVGLLTDMPRRWVYDVWSGRRA
jgi:hypothetical protein